MKKFFLLYAFIATTLLYSACPHSGCKSPSVLHVYSIENYQNTNTPALVIHTSTSRIIISAAFGNHFHSRKCEHTDISTHCSTTHTPLCEACKKLIQDEQCLEYALKNARQNIQNIERKNALADFDPNKRYCQNPIEEPQSHCAIS